MPYCAACGRSNDDPANNEPIVFNGIQWCSYCAKIKTTDSGLQFILPSSPGRIIEVNKDDPLEAWIDCFEMKPKKRILVKNAKTEIQRTWELWEGDKTKEIAQFKFFGWLNRHRPYLLTFRCKGDPWQKVHSWLIQYETIVQKSANNTINPTE